MTCEGNVWREGVRTPWYFKNQMSMHWYIPVDDLFQQRVLKEPAALKTILNKEHTSTINEVENVRLMDRVDVQKYFIKAGS